MAAMVASMASPLKFLILACVIIALLSVSKAQNATAATTVATTTTTTAAPSSGSPTSITQYADVGLCTCDLTASACDVECCCDPDCTSNDLLAFTQCADQYNTLDTRYCVQSQIIFLNNTPYQTVVTEPGILCIQTDNYATRHYYSIPDLVTSSDTFNTYKSTYGSFSFAPTVETAVNLNTFYRSGDPVYTIYDSGSVGYLSQPTTLASDYCVDSNPAAYLYDKTVSCTHPASTLADFCGNSASNAATYHEGFLLVPTPQLLNCTSCQNITGSNGTVGNDFVTIYNQSVPIVPATIHYCEDASGIVTNCSYISADPTLNGNATVCTNAVLRVTYRIKYNGTGGIEQATVEFRYGMAVSRVPVLQTFTTIFYQTGEEAALELSGSPGYVAGKPVRAGQIVTDGTNSAIQISSLYPGLTMLRSTANGQCGSSTDSFTTTVNFGVNARSGCYIPIYYSNFTSSCAQIHDYAWSLLYPSTNFTHVATFGNSSIQVVGDWVAIIKGDKPVYGGSVTPATCTGLLTGMNIEIIYANVGSLNNPQAKIIGVQYQYIMQDIRFQCVGPYCMPGSETLPQKLEIVSSVTFVDASQSALGVTAEIPIVTAKLPDDFFYPFV